MIACLLRRVARHVAFKHGRGITAWHSLCHPSGEEWAAWLKIHGGLHAIGNHCSIQRNVVITDPAYVRLGDNVRLSGCTLFGHDGSINMINRAFNVKLDRVGKIDIGNNVFVGDGARIMPGVTIGSNTVIAAGAVVTRDTQPNSVYAGVPARRVGSIFDLVIKMEEESDAYPWADLIAERDGAFDPAIEPELVRQRVAHFYPDCEPTQPAALYIAAAAVAA